MSTSTTTTVEALCRTVFTDAMNAFPDIEKVILSDTGSGHLLFVMENANNAAVIAHRNESAISSQDGAIINDSCNEFAHMATTTSQQLSKLSLGACQSITAIYDSYAVMQIVDTNLVLTIVVSRVGDGSPLGSLRGYLQALVVMKTYKDIKTAVKKVIENY